MKNPFVIFQTLPTFDIALTELTTHYRHLVTAYHPDKGGDAGSMEDINAAYNILKNPIKRARALVELKGIKITDEETLTDPMLLEEIFELRMNNDRTVIQQKQQQALTDFSQAVLTQDLKTLQQTYWRLLCLHKL
jgi:DnaJ-domain-containing protein 1